MILFAFISLIGLAYVFLNVWVMVRWLKRKVKTKGFFLFLVVTSILYLSILFWNRKSIEFFIDTKRIEKEAQKKTDKPNRYCTCNWSSLKLKKDDYFKKHLPLAKKITENRYVKDNNTLNKHLRNKDLVIFTDQDGYWVEHLTHSSMHLTPLALKRLNELGRLFRKNLEDTEDSNSYFVISSVTRTEKQQKQIVRAYPNSASRNKSTHSYGVSFDISKMIYKSSCARSLSALEQALSEMQKEGKLLICPEKHCIHITVVN